MSLSLHWLTFPLRFHLHDVSKDNNKNMATPNMLHLFTSKGRRVDIALVTSQRVLLHHIHFRPLFAINILPLMGIIRCGELCNIY